MYFSIPFAQKPELAKKISKKSLLEMARWAAAFYWVDNCPNLFTYQQCYFLLAGRYYIGYWLAAICTFNKVVKSKGSKQ